jgi:exodeoxyribonuclease V gamma subunit
MKLFVSNKLEILAERMAQVLSLPLESPFVPETIVVQSRGMEKWLSLELARHWGICANCRFPFPHHFAEEVFGAFLPDYQPDLSCDEDVLTWKIMETLPGLVNSGDEFAPVRDYLGDDNDQLKLYQLSRRIAVCFDQYTVFRSEMVLAWEEGRFSAQEAWQAKIWLAIHENQKGMHKAKKLQTFLQNVQRAPVRREFLPERLTIFGISYLPVYYLRVFEALSEHIEVNFFYLNPSPEFWADIQSEKEAGRSARRFSWEMLLTEEDVFHLDRGNPLLASWGAAGRDFFRLIVNIADQTEELFSAPEESNLLTSLQSDIYHLRDRSSESPKTALIKDDLSVQIHACHSPLREVETLHDALLELFEKDRKLLPKDILVMAPSIEEYAPYIEAVFATREPKIPFTVADRSITSGSLIWKDFLALLKVSVSRFAVGEVLSFLENPAIGGRYGLTESDVGLIRNWIEKTYIRWGVDALHRLELGLPKFDQNTWKAGLQRLKLGYAMAGRNQNLFEGILPCDDIEGQPSEALGRFLDFFESLVRLKSVLKGRRNLQEWAAVLKSIVNQFFEKREEYLADLFTLNRLCATMENHQQYLRKDLSVDVGVIRKYLETDMGKKHGSADYLAGAVTFCALLPMRSIPFEVIALIGMNYDKYPRQDRKLGFDLIQAKRRIGDRSARNDDRYLFLEALLSARKHFIISYIGQNIQDNEQLPPSVLLSELVDYIDRSFCLNGDPPSSAGLIRRHHLHAFHPDYFEPKNRLFTYSKEHYAAAVGKGAASAPSFYSGVSGVIGPVEKVVAIHDLHRFFKNPVKYYLERKLLMKLPDELSVDDQEPFTIDGLDAYRIKQELMDQNQEDRAQKIYQIRRAEGSIPFGVAGEFYFQKQMEKTDELIRAFASYIRSEKIGPLEVDDEIFGYRLVGTLADMATEFHLHFRPAKLKGGDYLATWIDHLILNHLKPSAYPRQSVLIGEDGAFLFGAMEDAEKQLKELMELFVRGHSRPLKLFARASFVYAESLRKQNGTDDAVAAARKEWLGDGYHIRAESESIENIICFGGEMPFDDEFRDYAQRIFGRILEKREKLVWSEVS